MSEEKMEMMETMENEAVESNTDDYTENSGSGKGIGLLLAGVAGIATVGTVVYKKLKAKKSSDKPRKKKKLMFVEVEDEATEEEFIDPKAEEVDESDEK